MPQSRCRPTLSTISCCRTSTCSPRWFMGLEVLTAVSLMLGIFVRLGGVVGALQIVNLWLGLYSAPSEWPWTYFFLFLLMLSFALHHYGRSLGLDSVIVTRLGKRPTLGRIIVAEAS